ncbi:MAG: SpoIIE family protein phosphatase [Bacteroidales bacterium]|nr:SpoIIE family protein phosphatase [Bacteroidales bacterium]
MKNKILKLIILFIFITLSAISQTNKPIANNGILDLSAYDFSINPRVELKGEWEFYWNKLYTPADFENQILKPDTFLTVPGQWTGIIINGISIPDTGFATYRLIIKNDPQLNNQNFMIRIKEIVSAYKIWWNGNEISSVGIVGKTKNSSQPGVIPILTAVDFNSNEIEVIVQISNFDHNVNSFYDIPVVGTEKQMTKSFLLSMFFDIIIFGAVLIMAFYHLGVFLFRRKNSAALAFFGLCFIFAIRILFTGNHIFSLLFTDILSWNVKYRINYFTFYAIIIALVLYFKAVFKEKKYKFFYYFAFGISGLFILTLATSSYFYTKLLLYYQLSAIIIVIFILFLMIKYIKDKRTGAVTLFITMFLFFLTGVNDVLYINEIIKTTTLTHLGQFILILGQSLTLARIFNKEFIKTEELTTKLDYHNQNLQELVEIRTEKIEMQKQDILQKNEELMVQKEELQVQKDEIVRQKDLIEDNNMFITDSIRYASTIQKAVLPSNDNIKKYFDSFFLYIPKNIVSGDFYWFNDTHEKYLFLGVGDCTGHGVPGAFLSLSGMYILNTVVIEKQIEDPKAILTVLDELFNNFLVNGLKESRDGMEIGIMRFEKNNFTKVVYAAAKTNIFIYNKELNKITRYRGSRRSIGLKNSHKAIRVNFENLILKINSNDVIYCATDGYIDQNNSQRQRLGTQLFSEILTEIANLPMANQKIELLKLLEEHQQNQDQRDDITVIGISLF